VRLGNDFREDLARCGPRAWLREQSLWAIAVYRYGRLVQDRSGGLRGRLRLKVAWGLQALVETVTGISLPFGVEAGPGLRIHHFGGVFIHNDVRLGRNCTLRQGVTIGDRHPDGPVPVLGDDVEVGAYAQVLGGITVGDGARIGAMTVVLDDVPAGATAVGVPARIVPSRT
jgi:serine O-acetyltransferase